MDWEVLVAAALPFGLILTRMSGLVLGLPMLISEIAPIKIRAAMVILLTVVFALSSPPVVVPEAIGVALVMEFIVGAGMGLLVRIALAAAELAGEISGMHLGFGFSQMVDPMTKQTSGPLTRLLSAIIGVMLFAVGGHHEIIRALASSLHALPPGSLSYSHDWTYALVDAGRTLFVSAIRIALPLVFVALATHLSFGLLTRVAPQLNLWAIGFLASIGVGLVSLSIFAPTVINEIRHLITQATSELAMGPLLVR